ncbi:MAG: ATP-binding cassette domain-containing protein [Lactobacillaceae bacterium]|jgi:ABC-type multidrug transport system ATPase subunit|nr:ATP-binding cassette domain-containing protein [Lactobacillaceae bacterium]
MKKIEINNLTKSYGEKTVLENVTIDIPLNSISFFVGKNGAGKTTLMDILVGLTNIEKGQIFIGEQLAKIPYSQQLREKIFLLPVENISIDYLTAMENIEYFQTIFNLNLTDLEIEKILTDYQLINETNLVESFSTGMKKRLDLAILEVIAPEIILLDEPSLGLDVYHVDFLRKKLLEYKATGKTVIVTSHDMSLANKIADQVYLFNNKKIEKYDAKKIDSEKMVLETYREYQ